MRNQVYIALCLFAFVGCSQGKGPGPDSKPSNDASPKASSKVIYGDDNRLDLYQVSDASLLALADSTVALVESKSIYLNDQNKFVLIGDSVGEAYGLCSTEPFYSQQVGAFCSGFLVGPDTLITAGHCIQDQDDCNNTKFAFGFSIKALGQTYNEFDPKEVVGCKSVVHSQHPSYGADFAVIKLDRMILHHAPLTLAKKEIGNGESIFVVGHPTGLPTKIAGGATVRDNSREGYFVANLDTYGGNSGSAVFNSKTLEVEGILVRGETDYAWNGECRVSNKCTNEGCRGEDVTKISSVTSYLTSRVAQW